MIVPEHIPTLTIEWTEIPGALVPNFLTIGIIPSIEMWISCRLYLLMRGHIDSAIGIKVVIGAVRNATSSQVRTSVGHSSIHGVRTKEAMIRTECRKTT